MDNFPEQKYLEVNKKIFIDSIIDQSSISESDSNLSNEFLEECNKLRKLTYIKNTEFQEVLASNEQLKKEIKNLNQKNIEKKQTIYKQKEKYEKLKNLSSTQYNEFTKVLLINKHLKDEIQSLSQIIPQMEETITHLKKIISEEKTKQAHLNNLNKDLTKKNEEFQQMLYNDQYELFTNKVLFKMLNEMWQLLQEEKIKVKNYGDKLNQKEKSDSQKLNDLQKKSHEISSQSQQPPKILNENQVIQKKENLQQQFTNEKVFQEISLQKQRWISEFLNNKRTFIQNFIMKISLLK